MRNNICIILAVVCSMAGGLYGAVIFSTIPPTVSYETRGIVSAFERMPSAILDPSKPFKEALQRTYPQLSKQAQDRGANMVIITSMVPIFSRDEAWLLTFGTAIKTLGQAAAMQDQKLEEIGQAQQPGGEAPSAVSQDIAGAWSGKLQEEGEKDTRDITVYITAGDMAGTYQGSFNMTPPGCEVTFEFSKIEGNVYYFKGKTSSKLKCAFMSTFSASMTPEGKLEWKALKGKETDPPKFSGLLERN